jgi:Fe-S cluster biogenesis protein NfuA/nitrite reductase/ring-hydroxylating ferredoxin subunit
MLREDRELTERAARIEALLDEIASLPDPAVRGKVADVVQGLLAFYGEGLRRMLSIVERDGRTAGVHLLEAFAQDELIAHLLLLHDLHPVDVETRVARALEEVRPYLQSHGGNVELLGIEGGVARLRLQGSCQGCASSIMTLKLAIEDAVRKAAPDLEGIEAEGLAEPPPRPSAFIPAASIARTEKAAAGATPAWTVVDGLPHLADGGMTAPEVSGLPLLFVKIEGTFYAYRNTCPACGQSLEGGTLRGAQLACPACGQHYDVRRAGRCPEAPDLYLEPIPLLVQDGIVRVACQQSAISQALIADS